MTPLPPGPFAAILADPPWRFRARSARGEGRAAQAHYATMPAEAIRALPVGDAAAPDSTLFLWATGPMLPEAFAVMAAWGFAYKAVAFVWAKETRRSALRERHEAEAGLWFAPGPGRRAAVERAMAGTGGPFHMGLGYWTRANAEFVLLGTRGRPRRRDAGVRQLVVAPVRRHSRKPDAVAGGIERLVAGPYLELFARATRPGWAAWGLQEKLFDAGDVETRAIPSGRLARALPPLLQGLPDD